MFAAADFGFSDPNDTPANSLLAVKITTLPSAGSGTLTDNGEIGRASRRERVEDTDAGKLVITAEANANGCRESSWTLQVQENGGTVNGAVDLAHLANMMTINVSSVDDAGIRTGHVAAVHTCAL